MELFVSQCKGCNHKALSFVALRQDAVCPKCGRKSLETISKANTDFNPELIIPTTTDKKKFLSQALDYMRENNFPVEAYKNINPDRIIKYLVPAFGYAGTVDGKWQCEYDSSSEITINNSTHKIQPGTPLSGETTGNSFGVFLPGALSGQEATNEWAEKFAFPTPTNNAKKIDASSLKSDETFTFLPSSDPMKVWNEKGQGFCDFIVQENVSSSLSDPFALWAALGLINPADAAMMSNQMGQNWGGGTVPPTRNWNIFSRSNLETKPVAALIPMWYLPFDFEGKTYYIAATADGNNGITCMFPTGSSTKKNITENEAIKEAEKKAKYVKLSGLVAIPLFFIANFIVTLIFLAAWFVAFKYFDKQVNTMKKEENDKSSKEIDSEIQKVISKLK